jgi:alginate O-acetyltransferase complex protein AlgI
VVPALGQEHDTGRRFQGWRFLKVILLFHIVCVTWIFFRADGIDQAFGMLGALFGAWQIMEPFPAYAMGILAFFVLPFLIYEFWLEKKGDQLALLQQPAVVQAAVFTYLGLMMMVFPPVEPQVFIYFQF